MDEHKYEIKRRQSDKRWCIYLVKFNVVIAEFVENITQGSIDEIARSLTNKSSLPDDTECICEPFYLNQGTHNSMCPDYK